MRVRWNALTESLGLAGRIGRVYGETAPSVTGVDVIGPLTRDMAFDVFFEDDRTNFWISGAYLECVERGAGTEVVVAGTTRLRPEDGACEDRPSDVPPALALARAGLLLACREALARAAKDPSMIEECAEGLIGYLLRHDALLMDPRIKDLFDAAGVAELWRATSYAQPIGAWDPDEADRRKRAEWEEVARCIARLEDPKVGSR